MASEVATRDTPMVWILWPDEDVPKLAPYYRSENHYSYMANRYEKCIFFVATEEEMQQPASFPIENITVEYIIQCDDDPVLGWTDEINITDYHGHGYTTPSEYFDRWTRESDGYAYRLITRTTRSNVSEELVKEKTAK